jgi:organic radical activating enzyme
MSKLHLDHIEFYITNVCNLSCENCRSFNNYNFKGHYKFSQTLTQQWADKVTIDSIAIIGGEPCYHPDLKAWIQGIRQAWPNARLNLISNGTKLSLVKNLHELLASNNCILSISSHGYNLRQAIAEEIFATFGECEVLPITVSSAWGVTNSIRFKSKLGVIIDLQNGNSFQDICFTDSKFSLHNSDPEKAHSQCAIKFCHHMIDYKIYKCSVIGLLPSFLKQQQIDTKHLQKYTGIDVDTVSQQSLDALKQSIPNCSICPESNMQKPIISVLKKDSSLVRIV